MEKLSAAVPEIVKASGKAGVYIITHVANQTIVKLSDSDKS